MIKLLPFRVYILYIFDILSYHIVWLACWLMVINPKVNPALFLLEVFQLFIFPNVTTGISMNRRRCCDFLDDFYRWWLNNVIYSHMHRLRCCILFLPLFFIQRWPSLMDLLWLTEHLAGQNYLQTMDFTLPKWDDSLPIMGVIPMDICWVNFFTTLRSLNHENDRWIPSRELTYPRDFWHIWRCFSFSPGGIC